MTRKCGWKSFVASIAVTVMLTLMVLQVSKAQEASIPIIGTCINSSYVQFYQNATIGGTSAEIVIPVTYCPFGCEDNSSQYGSDCRPNQAGNDTSYLMALIVAFGIISFILVYIAFKVDREAHGAIQILFTSLSVFFLWAISNVIEAVLTINNITVVLPLITTVENILIWGGVFFIFYLIVFFIWNLIKSIKLRREEKAKDPFKSGRGLA